MKMIRLPATDVPVMAEMEVLVVGSGPAGISAAVASVRTGAKTMLMERYGCFGGALSVGQVESYTWYLNESTVIAGGIAKEIEDRMVAFGATQDDERGIGHFLNPEKYKVLLDRWIQECGITPMLHTYAVGAVVEDGVLRGVVVESKSGRGVILADRVIDATGDGDVAAFAGAAFEKGRNNDGKVQPVTMVFGVSGVDVQKFKEYVRTHPETTNPDSHGLKEPFIRAINDGKWPVPRQGGAWKTLTPTGDFTSLNLTLEYGIDATNVWDLTKAEFDGRQQVMWAVDVLREYGKEMGFENCWLRSMGGQIGIRESRRIVGDYALTKDDVLGKKHFEDSIGVFTSFLDGYGYMIIAKDDGHFELPYRILIPKDIENLYVAGRCVSCEAEAIGATRMMVCCATTGQAAGTAAAMSIKDGVSVRDLDIKKLQDQLASDGVRLH